MDTIDLPVGVFEATAERWQYSVPPPENIQRNELTCATFNIWFGDHFAAQRYAAIARLLELHQPDFIALQEVTPGALDIFLEQPWIRQAYYASDIDGSTLGAYGVLLLSRLPPNTIKLMSLPSLMNRHLLVMETRVNDALLRVGTVHLESLKSSANVRGHQLKAIFNSLSGASDAVLMGDFNFCASWPAENNRIDPAYHDVWSLLRGAEPGYTEDTAINRMRYLIKGKHKQVRFDRVLLKSADPISGWQASSIELLGTEPISPDEPDVFPSDHFGLLCRFTKR